MRHLKSDVSHRMRRRPSIFTARWFRMILGGGAAVILALWLGPPVAGWLRAHPASPTGSASQALRAPLRPAEPTMAVAASRAEPKPEPRPAIAPAATGAAPATAETPAAKPAAKPDERAGSATAAAVPAGRTVFRVQVGAFLDHRNADRLAERLRSEGVEVASTLVEESRTMYRVLATPSEGDHYEALIERLRALGHAPELTDDGAAVTGPVPLRAAIETSRQLREQGIRVRFERGPSSAALRVVRAGAYGTAEEAERARAELAGRGYEGFVIRER